MIDYRTFRNDDPPGLVKIWREACTGRGAAPLPGTTLLEYFVFAKPYFDPNGLILATDAGTPVGFALGGFGPNAAGDALDTTSGVVCMVGVVSGHRRRGIGSELLRHCEGYLRGRGARQLYAGPMSPLDPFGFGIYGGSDCPGFLESDSLARPFLERHGYRPQASRRVFQCAFTKPPNIVDARFVAHRQRYEIHVNPHHDATWWQECVHGPLELHEFRLDERGGQTAGRVVAWQMETFDQRWGTHAVGLLELEIVPEKRRQGLARFLLAQLMRHLHDQFFNLVEVQTAADNEPAIRLLQGLGFTQVDTGHSYRLEWPPAAEDGGHAG